MFVYNEAADERHMKMSVACVSYTRLAAPCAYTHTHTHTRTHTHSLTHTMYIPVIFHESADERQM